MSNRQFLKVYYNTLDIIGSYTVDEEKINIDHFDCMIISRILDFQNDNLPCYITNEQMAKALRSTVRTVARRIANLIKLGIITSEVTLVSDNGKKSKVRHMKINYPAIAQCKEINKSKK